MSDLSELSRKELISIINQMKEENCLLKTQLNEYKNDSKKCKSEKSSQTVNNKSFSDRICDDLSPVLLQFLSLEDKARLECVSKQFERTVFKRHYELYINVSPKQHKYYLRNKNFGKRYDNYYYIEKSDQSMDSFEALLKKCPNITSIVLDRGDQDKLNQVFRLIIENCNNLNEVIVKNDINDSNFEEFQQKFGPKIKYLRTYRELIELNLFPNIEKVLIPFNDSTIAQLKLAQLKQLEIVFNQEHILQTVIDTFPTLTHLNLYISSYEENAIYKPLKNISNLKHLIHYKLNTRFVYNKRFCGLFKQMANNCKNLKSIDFSFDIDQSSDLRQLLSHLKAFPLKRLNLWLFFEKHIDVNQMFSFELFKGFENITHLTLGSDLSQTLKESILKEIDINLPNLQYLQIEGYFDTTPEGVQQMADILSRLSRLITIKLNFKPGVDFKPIEDKITKKCRKIREIKMF